MLGLHVTPPGNDAFRFLPFGGIALALGALLLSGATAPAGPPPSPPPARPCAAATPSHGLTVLCSLLGAPSDAAHPSGGVLVDADGALYATGYRGGSNDKGSLFSLTPSGAGYAESVLYSLYTIDGVGPADTPVRDAAGNIYFTAEAGGAVPNDCDDPPGCGSIFKMTRSGGVYRRSGLYTFRDSPDGAHPAAALPLGSSVFVTTAIGGDHETGAVVRLASADLHVLDVASFAAATDGFAPESDLAAGDGNALYGTTRRGGDGPCGNASGCGTIFAFVPGKDPKELFRFPRGAAGGYDPRGGLVLEGRTLYGTATLGGGAAKCAEGCGVVYALKPAGSGYRETVLHAFEGGDDGAGPSATLTQFDGYLYGTTTYGGAGCPANATTPAGCGTIFRIKPDGSKYATCYRFSGPDGANPRFGKLAVRDGALYGTTANGGSAGDGVVFRYVPATPSCT